MTDNAIAVGGYFALAILLFAGLGGGIYLFARYLSRRAARQPITERLNVAAVEKAIRRKRRLIRFYIIGLVVCLTLFVLMFVLTFRFDVELFDLPWGLGQIIVLLGTTGTFLFSVAAFGIRPRTSGTIRALRSEIRDLEEVKSSMTGKRICDYKYKERERW